MIVITTPTGQIGSQVLAKVLDGGKPIRVIARDASKLDPTVRDRVEVVEGSHGDAEIVDRAFAGADAVFWLVPASPQADTAHAAYVDFSRPAIEALAKHDVRRVIGISALGRGTDLAEHAGHVTATLALDDLIAGTGVAYRALTMPAFMDNLIWQAGAIRDAGRFFSLIAGDRRVPSCATRDIAAAAARLLLDDAWDGVGQQAVLGPEDLSFDDMARIMSDVLGKKARYQQITPEAFEERMLAQGMSEGMARATVDMIVAKDHGLDNAEPRTPEATTPTRFRTWCEDTLKPAVAS